MAQRQRWFFYNGKVTMPVRLVDGRSFSVRPRGHVYTTDELAAKSNNLRPCAAPDDAASILADLAISPPQEPAVPGPGALAEKITELGKSTADKPAPEPPKPATPKLGALKAVPRAASKQVTVPDETS